MVWYSTLSAGIRAVKTRKSPATYFRGSPIIRRNTPALSYDLLVVKWDPVQPHHVRQAAAEYDQLGQDGFLGRHGFGRAQAYLLS
jgi:hypothetical protein